MTTKPAVKHIKEKEREVPKRRAKTEPAAGPNKWSSAVQSWVTEFQQRRRSESLPAFESLFK